MSRSVDEATDNPPSEAIVPNETAGLPRVSAAISLGTTETGEAARRACGGPARDPVEVTHDGPVFDPPPFHPARPGLVAPVRIDPTGRTGPTRAQARGPHWRRVAHGWYVPAHVDLDDPLQRIVEASVLLPAYGGVTGWAGLRWLYGRWFDGVTDDGRTRLPVTLATGGQTVRQQRGMAISEETLPPGELVVVDGLSITRPLRSACFEMRYAESDERAARVLDMAAYSDLVSIGEMTAYVHGLTAMTGVPRCRRALPLADKNSWSPRESRMRMAWERENGLPRPLCNVPVFDRTGHHVGTPDLLDPVAGVVGEYDGGLHLAASRRARDLRREHEFRHLGLEYVTMIASDQDDLSGFLARLQSTYRRARHEPPDQRRWTIEPPPWWVPTCTVEQRRALDSVARDRLLAHRRSA